MYVGLPGGGSGVGGGGGGEEGKGTTASALQMFLCHLLYLLAFRTLPMLLSCFKKVWASCPPFSPI